MTVESYISQGMMVASISSANNKDVEVPSLIPKLFLYVWASTACKSPFQKAVNHLLKLRLHWENVLFETFNQQWEVLIRYCRPSRYASISIQEVYDGHSMAYWTLRSMHYLTTWCSN